MQNEYQSEMNTKKKYNDTFRSWRICRHHQLFFVILKKFGLSFCGNVFVVGNSDS